MHVRKNAATLTNAEWERFMRAVIALKHSFAPGSNISVYDQFVAIHQGVTQLTGAQTTDGGHRGPAFLSWHREYIRRFEAALQQIDPTVALPYWNWGLGPIEETTALFREDRIGTMGSGGTSNFEIETGYLARNPNTFNPMGWEVHAQLRPFGAALQRNSSLNTGPGWPSGTLVNAILGETNFHNFRPALETPHGTIHVRVGRDMGRMTSPNDPIFFLHHCQVDRIWAIWQQDHSGSANFNPNGVGGTGHQLNDPIWPWDGGASQTTVPGISSMVPSYPQTDVVRNIDLLVHRELGYCYDDEDDCPCGGTSEPDAPTLPRWEDFPTIPRLEELPTTMRLGEEGPPPTTMRFGEEGFPPTTLALGEEGDPSPTTLAIGEEGGPITLREDDILTSVEDIPDRLVPRRSPFGRF